MSNRKGKISKIKFREGKLCQNCLKSKLEPCECSGCKKRKKHNLVCKTFNWSNF
jgi:hypothetical protein